MGSTLIFVFEPSGHLISPSKSFINAFASKLPTSIKGILTRNFFAFIFCIGISDQSLLSGNMPFSTF